MKRIQAFTLMEVTIAMLLSAICISICYSAFKLAGDYYHRFEVKNRQADEVLSLKQVLEKDFLKCRYAFSTGDELKLRMEGQDSVFYLFFDEKVLRQIPELHTDTFRLNLKDRLMYFEGQNVLDADTIDRLDFTIELKNSVRIPVRINKLYSAENLFQ